MSPNRTGGSQSTSCTGPEWIEGYIHTVIGGSTECLLSSNVCHPAHPLCRGYEISEVMFAIL